MSDEMKMYDRQSLQELLNCSYSKARRVFKNIFNTIPKKDRKPEHKKSLPGNIVNKYLFPQ